MSRGFSCERNNFTSTSSCDVPSSRFRTDQHCAGDGCGKSYTELPFWAGRLSPPRCLPYPALGREVRSLWPGHWNQFIGPLCMHRHIYPGQHGMACIAVVWSCRFLNQCASIQSAFSQLCSFCDPHFFLPLAASGVSACVLIPWLPVIGKFPCSCYAKLLISFVLPIFYLPFSYYELLFFRHSPYTVLSFLYFG